MDRARYIRAHERRGLIPDILSDVLPPKDPLTTLSQPLGVITSLIPLPSQSVITSESLSDLSNTFPSSSSSASLPSSSSLTTQSISESNASRPTPTPTPTPIAQSVSSVYETTSGGKVNTITTFVNVTSSAAPSQSATTSPNAFLRNKALSGVIFALVSLVILAIILAIATFAIRRKRNHQLLKEAISFNPSSTLDSAHHYTAEKGRLSTSYSSHRSSDDHNNHTFHGRTRHMSGADSSPPRAEQKIGYSQPPATGVTPEGSSQPVPILPNFFAINQSTGTVDEYDYARNGNLKVANK